MSPEAEAFAFPWDDLLWFAFRTLRWTPRAVWAATPREFAAALRPPRAPAAARADLDRLIAAFPDP